MTILDTTILECAVTSQAGPVQGDSQKQWYDVFSFDAMFFIHLPCDEHRFVHSTSQLSPAYPTSHSHIPKSVHSPLAIPVKYKFDVKRKKVYIIKQ